MTVSGLPATICSGSSATVTVTANPSGGSGSPWTYAWTVPSGAGNPGNVSSFSATVAGNYSVKVTDSVGNYNSSSAATLTVNTGPSAPTASNGGTVCEGSTLYLYASTVSGATYAWTGPNGFTSAAQNPTIPNATATATGTYSVTATVSGCTSAAGTTYATVGDTTPPTIIAPADVNIDL